MNEKKLSDKIFDVLSKIGGEQEKFRDIFNQSFSDSQMRWPFNISSGVCVVYVSKKNEIEIENFEPRGFETHNEILKRIIKINSKLKKVKQN